MDAFKCSNCLSWFGLKCFISSAIVVGAVAMVAMGAFYGYGRIPVPAPVDLTFLLLALILLAYFEGLQVAIVNAQAMPYEQTPQLSDSKPRAYKAYLITFHDSGCEKFMIGRQLVVIITVFLISKLTSFPTMPQFFPSFLHHTLITTGFPGVMITLTFAQMSPQLIADEYTLRFLDLYGCLLFVKFSIFIETIGIFTNFSWCMTYIINKIYFQKSNSIFCNDDDNQLSNNSNHLDISNSSESQLISKEYSTAAYRREDDHINNNICLVPNISKEIISFQPIPIDININTNVYHNNSNNISNQNDNNISESYDVEEEAIEFHVQNETLLKNKMDEKPHSRNTKQSIFAKHFQKSIEILKYLVSGIVTLLSAAIVLYGIIQEYSLFTLPPPVLILLLLLCLVLLFYLEGLQIAVISAQHLTEDDFHVRYRRGRLLHKLLSQRSDNVKRFLIGRQFLVIFTVFTIANITTFDEYPQSLIPAIYFNPISKWGLAGVLLTLNSVQMPSQMIAKRFPVQFVDLPGAYLLVYIALAVESAGITHCGWVCYSVIKYAFAY